MWDAFWRALWTCLHPRVLLWWLHGAGPQRGQHGGLLGLLRLHVGRHLRQGHRGHLLQCRLPVGGLLGLLRALVAPMVVVALSVPAVLVLTLLLVATLATPAVVRVVVARRFPDLQALQGGSTLQGIAWALACTLAALLALVLSLPLWLVPPLVMVLPPLIWGWLTCRVLAFDVLAQHASAAERRVVMRGRRWTLLAMGILCGYLGALPSLLWTASSAALLLAPLVALVAVWLYTVVFVFAACWFAHFCLAELQRLRLSHGTSESAPATAPASAPEPTPAPSLSLPS